MRSLATLLIVLGFGSLLLPMFDMQFTFMSWADRFQPIGGIVVGLIGVGLLVAPMLVAGRSGAAPASPASPTQDQPPAA